MYEGEGGGSGVANQPHRVKHRATGIVSAKWNLRLEPIGRSAQRAEDRGKGGEARGILFTLSVFYSGVKIAV